MKQKRQLANTPNQKPFDWNAELIGQAIFPSVRALPGFVSRTMWNLLKEIGVDDPQDDQWYNVKIFVAFYEKLVEEYGPHTLYDLGKAIPDVAVFPPDIQTLEEAIGILDTAYGLNHRGGYLGFYRLVEHDPMRQEMVVHCYNPYPCELDRGLLTGLGRKYANMARVTVDTSRPHKKMGASQSWYRIKYS